MGKLHAYDTGVKTESSVAPGTLNLRDQLFNVLSQYIDGIVKVDDGNNHYIRDSLFNSPALGIIPKHYSYSSRYYITVHGTSTSPEYGRVVVSGNSSSNLIIYHTAIKDGCIFSLNSQERNWYENFIYALFRRKSDNHLILIYSGGYPDNYNFANGFILADLSINAAPIVEYDNPKLPHESAKINTENISLAPFIYDGFDYEESNSIFLSTTYPVLASNGVQSFILNGKEYVNLRTIGGLPFVIELVS